MKGTDLRAPGEHALVEALHGMMAGSDILMPLAAAEKQFRDHYYGLNSAALLEDLFFDAFGNYLARHRPEVSLDRPAPGQKGCDYAFDKLHISHKVSQGPGVIAAIWDATKKGVTEWSFDTPIVYVCSGHSPPTRIKITLPDGDEIAVRGTSGLRPEDPIEGRPLLIVAWPSGTQQPTLLRTVPTDSAQSVSDALPFESLWHTVTEYTRRGGPINDIDILVPTSKTGARRCLRSDIFIDRVPLDISVRARSGIYIFPVSLLQNLAVTSNNRGILIPKDTIQQLMNRVVNHEFFVPFPLWYQLYAEDRPPDLYLAQRAEYDHRFSVRSRSPTTGR